MKHEVNLMINTSISEGICGSIVESLFLKIPILVRNNISNLEFLNNGQYGYIF